MDSSKKSDKKYSLNPSNSPPSSPISIKTTSTPPTSSPLRKMVTTEPSLPPQMPTSTPTSLAVFNFPPMEPSDYQDSLPRTRHLSTMSSLETEKRLRSLSRSGSVNPEESPIVRPIPIPHPLPLRRLSRSVARSGSLSSPQGSFGTFDEPSTPGTPTKTPPTTPPATPQQKIVPLKSPGRRRSLTISQPYSARKDADATSMTRARTSSNLTIPSPLGIPLMPDSSSEDERGRSRERWADPVPKYPGRLLALSTSLPRIRSDRKHLQKHNSFSQSPTSHNAPVTQPTTPRVNKTESALPFITRTAESSPQLQIPKLHRHDSGSTPDKSVLRRSRKPSFIPPSATVPKDDYTQALLDECRLAKLFRWKGDMNGNLGIQFVDWQLENAMIKAPAPHATTRALLRINSSRSSSPASPGPWDEELHSLAKQAIDEEPKAPGLMRSLSDGDLTDYLKTFSEIKTSLKAAKDACDAQISRIIVGLQEHVEMEIRKREDAHHVEVFESDIIDPIEYGKQRMTDSKRKTPLLPLTTLDQPKKHQRHRSTSSLRPPSRTGSVEDSMPTPFESALSELIGLAQAVLEMDHTTCMLEPKRVQELLSRIQKLQEKWDANPSWPCRDYLVRLLLVIGGVGRIVEHLQQDERLWNIGDKNSNVVVTSTSDQPLLMIEYDSGTQAYLDDVPKPTKQTRKERTKKPQGDWSLTELKEATEEAKNLTVLIEMDVDTGYVNYVSPSCKQVFGFEHFEIVGQSQPPIMDAEAHHVFSEAIRSLRLAGDRISMEILFKAIRKDGRMLDMVAQGVLMPDKTTGVAKNVLWVTKPVGLVGEGWDENSMSDTDSIVAPPSPSQVTAPSLLDTPSERSDKKLELVTPQEERNAFLDEAGDEGDDEAEEALEEPKRASPRKPLSDAASVASQPSRPQSREAKARAALLSDGDKMWARMSKTRLPPIEGLVEPDFTRTASPMSIDTKTSSSVVPEENVVQAATQSVTCKICDRDVLTLVFERHHAACLSLHRAEDTIGTVNDELRECSKRLEEIHAHLSREVEEELEDLAQGFSNDGWTIQQHDAFLSYLRTLLKVCEALKLLVGDTLAIPTPENEFDASDDDSVVTPPRTNDTEMFTFSPITKLAHDVEQLNVKESLYEPCPEACSIVKRIRHVKSFSSPPEDMFYIPPALNQLLATENQDSIQALQEAGKSVFAMTQAVQALIVTKYDNIQAMHSYITEMAQLWNEEDSLRVELSQVVDSDVGNVIPPSSDEEFLDAHSEVETEPLKDHEEINIPNQRRKSMQSVATSLSTSSSQGSPVRMSVLRTPRIRTLSESESRSDVGRRESRLRNAIRASDSDEEWNLVSEDSDALPQLSSSLGREMPKFDESDTQSVASRRRGLSHSHPLIRTKEAMLPMGRQGSTGTLPGSPSLADLRSQPSINDFEVIKPISKGAYGSVYLAKKKQTGDYYALKILRKSDMVQKNQVSNVRNERMILTQLDSPFVVKLYYSFQSKDSLYLVMEYLNGGDVAALIKAMGQLDEKWAKQYVAEVILGLEFLHARGIVHRDLKPDNLLIDTDGHLKLTDFGLSRVGFLGRRKLGLEMMTERRSSLPSSPMLSTGEPDTPSSGENTVNVPIPPLHLPPTAPYSPFVAIPHLRHHARRASMASTTSNLSDVTGPSSRYSTFGSLPKSNVLGLDDSKETNQFVGTPDYLAPESILGLGQDASVDWWALGVMTYEFLYGIPPFHADTPNQVFENILARRLEWPEDVEISDEAKDFMDKLMTTNVESRMGSKGGASEVKRHPWLQDVDWSQLLSEEANFVPKPQDIEDTFYFDDRGVKELKKSFDDAPFKTMERRKEEADFGRFAFKNLDLLEKENEGLMEKIRSDLQSITQSASALDLSSPFLPLPSKASAAGTRRRTVTSSAIPLMGSTLSFDLKPKVAISLERGGLGASTPLDPEVKRPTSPGHTRSVSVPVVQIAPEKPKKKGPLARCYDVLVVEDNPITAKIMETMLTKLGCRTVVVRNGAEAVRCANGDVKFDLILMDVRLPIMHGDDAARMIKSVINVNQTTPIIAITAFEVDSRDATDFDDVLNKPVSQDQLIKVFKAYFEGEDIEFDVGQPMIPPNFGTLEYVPIETATSGGR